ncbi:hypothetical protein [Luteibacter aegosomatissinici]|uniref:hypothetical protein n=1 Tax=Luteibacter aegosomatissinici TaxID=2911539 RepID=UPI001FFA0794|nr:hypothetical protein [Luteibacter aegosomatissinici]UPG94484.1 hypothetical protein L2Y97_22140 [Luteibacter aegosomatissinici]
MPCIAIVDDTRASRVTLGRRIKQKLRRIERNDWEVIDSAPLKRIQEYDAWIVENDVTVLILDEKLGDRLGDDDEAVDYTGHAVAQYLRERLPTLPQFIITAVADTEELEGEGGALDGIIARGTFNARADVYIERMIRAGTRFVDENTADLSEMGRLAEARAVGELSEGEQDRLNALRTRFLASSAPAEQSAEQVVDGAITVLAELRSLANDIRESIAKKSS